MRINELLREKSRLTPQDFISIQNDTLSIPARELKPVLLDAVKGVELGQREIAALEALKRWDDRFDEESVGATIFDAWFEKLKVRMWGERLGESKYYMHPPLPRTIKIIREEPNSKWFDNPGTPEVETLRDQAVIALNDAVADLGRRLGRDVNDWKWHKARPTMFSHVAKLPGLGEKMTVRGAAQSVFSNSGGHGPVWKLVVALGSKPKAWCVYPGGQSGDPSSLYYNNFMEPWRKGELREVVYLLSAKDANPRLFRQWHLEKQ
jgi:penicillin amidase